MPYPTLTSPITIGGLTLKNRMAMSPMATYYANPDGTASERHRAYYEARARSGLGLIRLESAVIHPTGQSWPRCIAIWDDRGIPALAELVQAIKQHGARVFLQLNHGGRVSLEALTGCQPMAPSPLPGPGGVVPREMTVEEIETMIEAFGQAARRAREAGLDGVELHMDTAYLLLSFISPAQNVRQDEYGRDFAGRLRFPLRCIQRMRELAGADYLIGARIAASDYHDGGVDLPYCQQVAKTLEAAGLAYLCVTTGLGPNQAKASPLAMGYGEGVLADLAAGVKSVVAIPVMSVGRYYSLASAEAVLAAGKADLIVFGRALLADPAIVAKSLRGEEHTVIPCIGCEACLNPGGRKYGASCTINPETGHEYDWRLEPAARPRQVLVLGSGLPGLELARVAARRGHAVTVATAGLPFGGLLGLRAGVPAAAEVGRAVKYFQQTLADLGVRVVDEPPAETPDVIVDTRPGSPIRPSGPGLDPAAVVLGEQVLAGQIDVATLGQRVAVVGPGIYAGETALSLAAAGKAVTLLATGDRPMEDAATPLVSGKTAVRFAAYGGRTIAGVKLLGLGADGVLTAEVKGERQAVGPFDRIVAAIGWEPPAGGAGGRGHVLPDVWDAFAARLQVAAAARLGREL